VFDSPRGSSKNGNSKLHPGNRKALLICIQNLVTSPRRRLVDKLYYLSDPRTIIALTIQGFSLLRATGALDSICERLLRTVELDSFKFFELDGRENAGTGFSAHGERSVDVTMHGVIYDMHRRDPPGGESMAQNHMKNPIATQYARICSHLNCKLRG
jgi:hypothetical protein